MAAKWQDSYSGGRGGRPQVSFGFEGTWLPVVKWILIANIVVYALQLVSTTPPDIPEGFNLTAEEIAYLPKRSLVQEWLQLDTAKVLKGQIWRLATGAFCHSRETLFHIIFNMLFLIWFGRRLEALYRSTEFALFYGCAAIVSSLAYMAVEIIMGDLGRAIGASGAVLGVLMLYAMHYPRDKIYLWFVLKVEMRWVVLAYVIYDLYPVLLAFGGDKMNDGVGHAAHLGGLAFGFAYFQRGWRFEPLWRGLVGRAQKRPSRDSGSQPKGPARKEKARVGATAKPTAPPRSKQVDEILDKISEQGIHSITEEERKILDEQSNQFRNRN